MDCCNIKHLPHIIVGRVTRTCSYLERSEEGVSAGEGLVCAMLFVGALTGAQCEHSRGRTMYAPTDVRFMFVRNTRRWLTVAYVVKRM